MTGEAATLPTIPTQIAARAAAPDKATTPAKATARPRAKAAKAGTSPAKAVAKTPAKAAGATARRAAKTATTARRATKARAGAAADGDGRQYRRMPDPAELVGAYNDAASVTELAARYEVPRHTMNGWLARLRREGLIVARRGAAARS